MTREEMKRYTVVTQLIQGTITGREAAELLELSTRQVYRLKKRVLEEGETGIIHKNRGRKPAHALTDAMRNRILELHQSERYQNCNDVHFSELLSEYEGISVSASTVRRIRVAAGLKAKRKRRPAKVHRPRERKAQFGMLVQMDGSPHPWLEERAKPMSLLAAIDDATGKIVGAVFREQEDTEGYFLLTQQMAERVGIPMSVYSDQHTIFRSPNEKQTIEQELAGEPIPLSQFGQVLQELGVTHIKATTPQAKGRVERLFQTLQDRWVIELRLRDVQTIEEANRVLPELIEAHNQAFAVEPASLEHAFVPLQPGQSLAHILCYREKRTVGSGETIAYHGKTYKIDASGHQPTIPIKTRVEVRQTIDGELFVWYNRKAYPLREVVKPKRVSTPVKEKASLGKKPRPNKPAVNHPWRQYRRTNSNTRILQQA